MSDGSNIEIPEEIVEISEQYPGIEESYERFVKSDFLTMSSDGDIRMIEDERGIVVYEELAVVESGEIHNE